MNLLNLSRFFIEILSLKTSKPVGVRAFQVLHCSTSLSTWLGHITVIFLGLINKSKAYFLIPKSLSIAHSSSYFIAALTV